ncbi:MAG: hypothetical protein FJ151_04700 [Euryarchaeota archaeon]|nr:hypothetical protein [Euryarchaeota archaeon]
MAVKIHMSLQDNRPFGCPFDAYGADEETLRDLTCGSCMVSSIVCEYKGEAVLVQLARRAGWKTAEVISKP